MDRLRTAQLGLLQAKDNSAEVLAGSRSLGGSSEESIGEGGQIGGDASARLLALAEEKDSHLKTKADLAETKDELEKVQSELVQALSDKQALESRHEKAVEEFRLQNSEAEALLSEKELEHKRQLNELE